MDSIDESLLVSELGFYVEGETREVGQMGRTMFKVDYGLLNDGAAVLSQEAADVEGKEKLAVEGLSTDFAGYDSSYAQSMGKWLHEFENVGVTPLISNLTAFSELFTTVSVNDESADDTVKASIGPAKQPYEKMW
jgi:hypothetical protein